MAFAPAQCRDAAGGDRMSPHGDYHDRESEIVVASLSTAEIIAMTRGER